MKKLVIALALIGSYVAGAVSQQLYFGECIRDVAESMREGQSLLIEKIAPAAEIRAVAALRATVDTLWLVRKLDAEGATPELRTGEYGEQLLGRMADVRQTLNNANMYGNEYAVQYAFDRANKTLEEMGNDTQLKPYY
ncbi:MAG: hypothetical protein OEM85_05500 [Gammaproteobacteria bacterium]|nr:hypothetical protein [Gammaproteobacteria bacterium]MDH3372815.1 hypothetical protein [Gammaproteobacteria bacterium]MDH3407969.1 hypothetical protein [Gammaproteobacteria bacterium]